MICFDVLFSSEYIIFYELALEKITLHLGYMTVEGLFIETLTDNLFADQGC